MSNTVTHQQIVDHGISMIEAEIKSAREISQRYYDEKITWLTATNLIHGNTMRIIDIEATLIPLLPATKLLGNLHQCRIVAVAELEQLQREMRKFLHNNIHTVV